MEPEPIQETKGISNTELLDVIQKILPSKKAPVSKRRSEHLVIARKANMENTKKEKERLALLDEIEKNGHDLQQLATEHRQKQQPTASVKQRVNYDW